MDAGVQAEGVAMALLVTQLTFSVLEHARVVPASLLDLLESNGYDFVSSTVDNIHNFRSYSSVYYFKKSTQKA